MEAESSGRPRSFEDAAFALVQALSPGKRLSKEHIPFKQLRQAIGEFVDEHRHHMPVLNGGAESPATASESFKPFAVEEKNGGSNLEMSDDSSSRVSLDDSAAFRPKNLFRSKGFDRVGSEKSNHNSPKYSRKLTRIRLRRREALQIKDFIPFDCSEAELVEQFHHSYKEQLSRRASGVEVFFVILNSLRNFFQHKTWSANVEKLTNEFLEHYVFKKSLVGSNTDSDSKGLSNEELLKEAEVMILTELHLLQSGKELCDVNNTDIMNKMRFIYFSGGAQRMRKFLDEPVADLFSHVLPKVVVQIYEGLCVTLPSDLEEFANMDDSVQEPDARSKDSPVVSRKITQVESLNRLLKEEDSDSEDKPSTSHSTQPAPLISIKQQRRLSASARRSRQRPDSLIKTENEPGTETSRNLPVTNSRTFIVPETPEAKVKKRKRGRSSEDDDRKKTVKQTPLGKISKVSVSSRKSSKYSALLRKSSSRSVLNEATQNDPGELSPPTSPTRRFSTRSQARDSFLPSPPTQASSSATPPSRSNGVRKPSFLEKIAQCAARQPSSDNATSSSHSQPEKVKEEFTLEKNIVDKYRKRIEYVRHTQRKADKNEVFYGRTAKRSNLFEINPTDEMAMGMTTRSSACQTVQKNRSGRSVDSSRVHLAHALLNVHNSEPLNPSKAPKTSPFKLHRMVRPATKSDRRKLSKLRIRINRERLSVSISANSSPVTEEPSASSVPVET